MSLTNAGGNFVMVEQSPFASGQAAFLDLAPETFVVIHRIRQQVQCDLVAL